MLCTNIPLYAGMELTRPQIKATSEGSTLRTKLIFVDDETAYRQIVKAELEDEGFSVTDFSCGEAMLDRLEGGVEADIVVLDWSLGKIDAIDLLLMMRERGINLPVVLLTARSTPVHERLALQRGVTDFIDKSRGTDILAARLRLIAANKRTIATTETFRCGHLVLHPAGGRVSWKDCNVDLTVSEFKVLHLIASGGANYTPYRKIYDAVRREGFVAGSGEHGYRANVRSSIKRIRNKFRECDAAFDQIKNYTGFGYCWDEPSK